MNERSVALGLGSGHQVGDLGGADSRIHLVVDVDARPAVPGRIEVFQFGFVLKDGEREPVVAIGDGAEIKSAALQQVTVEEVLGLSVEELGAESVGLLNVCLDLPGLRFRAGSTSVSMSGSTRTTPLPERGRRALASGIVRHPARVWPSNLVATNVAARYIRGLL